MSRGSEIISNIINQSLGEDGSNFSTFLSNIGYSDQDKITFWKDLITRIQSQQGKDEEGNYKLVDGTDHPYPVRYDDWPHDNVNDDPLIEIVAEFCNLKPDEQGNIMLSDFYKLLRGDEEEQADFWNESIQELVNKIKEYSMEENPVIIHIDGGTSDITLADFKLADAGNNYQTEDVDCVIPFLNINKKTYNEVRNTDQVKDTIKDLAKMDYTNNHSEWITLLMPRYGRKTQIEDLNRNFWVISEAIDGIMSWIYGESPVNGIIEELVNEITQLWENTLYLWLEIALTNQKKSEEIRIISTVATSYNSEHLAKNDNIPIINCQVNQDTFILTDSSSNKFEPDIFNFNYLQKEYSDSIIGVLPIYRINNYRSNYYSGELYDNFLIWDNNIINEDGESKFLELKIVESYQDNNQEKIRPVVISPRYEITDSDIKRFSPYIFATNLNGTQYYYTYPFSKTNEKQCEDGRVLLYGCLLVRPQISFLKQVDGTIKFSNFILNIYDAAAHIGNLSLEEDRKIGRFVLKDSSRIYDENNNIIELVYEKIPFSQEETQAVEKRDCNIINKAYYLGSVASWRDRATSYN